MDEVVLTETFRLARAAERLGCLRPGDWPDLAVALLVEGAEDPEIAELAGFDQYVSAWTVVPLTATLFERYEVPSPDTEGAVNALAGLMAADLRTRPASVTGPMIRLLARLAPPNFESSLATQCYGVEDYLDCDYSASVDMTWESELEALIGPRLPDTITRVLAAPLRRTLPTVQPPRGH